MDIEAATFFKSMLSSLTRVMLKLRKNNEIIEMICKKAGGFNLVDMAMYGKDIPWRIYREARWLNLVKIALFGEEACLEWMPQLVIHLNICLYHSLYSFIVVFFWWSIILFMSRTARQLTQGTQYEKRNKDSVYPCP